MKLIFKIGVLYHPSPHTPPPPATPPPYYLYLIRYATFPYAGWAQSHFTLLKANKTKHNKAKKTGSVSNER